MAEESLGSGRIDLIINTDQWNAAITAARDKAHGLGADAVAAMENAKGAAANATTRLLQWSQALGKTTEEQKLLYAAMRGVPTEVLDAVRQKVQEHRNALADAAQQARELAAAEAQAASQSNFLKSLESQAVAIGKTRAQLLELKAAELGVSEQAAPFIAKLREQENALIRGGTQFNKYGLSVKQTEAALRQVPAQMTDIFVSLQGGQAPLTVLLQQGGQLRDIFGGIRPAAEALGNAFLKLVNPTTLLIAGGAALIASWFKGQQESYELAKAVALVGDNADITASQITRMSRTLDVTTRSTQSASAAALEEIAATGKFVGAQFQLVAEAALNMQNSAGVAVKDTVAKFASLADDPVKAVAKLNAETHFLTETQYQQIKALQEQGRTQEAATLAMETYAATVNSRAADVEGSLGTLQIAWRGIVTVAKEAWDAMLDVGREDTLSDRMLQLGEDLDKLKNDKFAFLQYGSIGSEARNAEIQRRSAELRALVQQERDENRKSYQEAAKQEANDYAVAQDGLITAHLSADQKRAKEIERSRKEADAKAKKAIEAGDKELAATIRANQTKYEAALNAENKGRSSLDNALSKRDLQALKDALAQRQGEIQNSMQMLQALYSAGLVPMKEYYARTRELTDADAAAQETALTGQIELLKQRNVTGKDAADVQRQLGQLEAQLAKVRADAATKLAVLAITEANANKKRREALEDYRIALDNGNDALQKSVNAAILRVGLGQKEADRAEQLANIYGKQAIELQKLVLLKERDPANAADYDAKIEALRAATDAEVAIVTDGFARMDAAQADWNNGARAAWMDWADNAANFAQQAGQITTNLLDGLVDGLNRTLDGNKEAWRDYLLDITRQIERFLLKQAILKFASMFLPTASAAPSASFASGFGNNTDWLTNGSMGGNGGAGFSLNAKGGVYSTPSLDKYVNGIYNTPQPFLFAKGAQFGIFAEAGTDKPEAIMPLKRGPDGDLGVRMFDGGGGMGDIQLNVTTNVYADGKSETSSTVSGDGAALFAELNKRIAEGAQSEIQRAMRPGGVLWRAGVNGV